MEIVERELTKGQGVLLARTRAVTDAQFDIARQIAQSQLGILPDSITDETLIQLVQIVAKNYLAEVTRAGD